MKKRRVVGWVAVAVVVVVSLVGATAIALDYREEFDERQQVAAERVAQVLNMASLLTISQLEAIAELPAGEDELSSERFRDLIGPVVRAHPAAAFAVLAEPEAEIGGAGPGAGTGAGDGRATATGIPAGGGREFVSVHTTGTGPLARLAPADRETGGHLREVIGSVLDEERVAASRASSFSGIGGAHILIAHPAGAVEGGVAVAVVPVGALIQTANLVAREGSEVVIVEEDGTVLPRGAVVSDYGTATLSIADRSWEVRLASPGAASILVPLLIGLGGLLVAMTMALLLINWSRRERAALELARLRVSERDRALRAEAEMNRMYRILAENLTDMVVVADTDGTINYVSPACSSMLGWDPDELKGRKMAAMVHSDDLVKDRGVVDDLLASPGVHTFEHRILRKGGDYIWVETAMRSVEDPETGKIVELQSTSRDISERKPLQDQLERLAREDSLTGLANRRSFREVLDAEASRSSRSDSEFAVLMIDVDNFKDVNDSYGHLTGDSVIQSVARRIRERLRSSDTLARLGGDEFAAILPETGEEEAEVVALEIMEEVRAADTGRGDAPAVTVSIGVAGFSARAPDELDAILEAADRALYEAKNAGRDAVRVHQPRANPTGPA